jgi:small subunit ribosomal protein S2
MSTVTEVPEVNQEQQSQDIKDKAKKLLRDLVEAGVHLGHPKKDWNPKMEDYIFDTKDGIHIINLSMTVNHLFRAADFLKQQAKLNKNILLVGTSKQTSQIIKDQADRAEIFYINQRWLGGLITNFETIRARLNKLRELELQKETGGFQAYAKKEVASINRQIFKLNKSLGGLKKMRGKPEVIVAFDQTKDSIALIEARKVNCATVALTDTNCDPTGIDFIIPANDDSMRSIDLIAKFLTDAIIDGKALSKKR